VEGNQKAELRRHPWLYSFSNEGIQPNSLPGLPGGVRSWFAACISKQGARMIIHVDRASLDGVLQEQTLPLQKYISEKWSKRRRKDSSAFMPLCETESW
jgi:hypothetical protein